ncbi:Protein N-acetyltransferase, RimJ/RimL family [Marivirga sericea]|uniref:Protein N-acetyltransferase, RimJ/RimL family n=1 Tax=Marivirga sericea TaxID=1028 RepID=A0A1X7J757_9BACT|nr:GNAT family protein [Marivirga sericea]SMG23525.1 Protein N-acetyltransferase, RimJ/RimL family [Marivirga sericea]
MVKAKEFESERLSYKPLNLNYCTDQYVNWLNDYVIYQFLETGGNYTKEMLNDYLHEVQNSNIYFWAIHLKENQKHIGNIKIDPINSKHSVGEYGIMMGDKLEWGKGYAAEASNRVIRFCFFEGLNLRKITLGVLKDNIAAVKLYEKLGFEEEGRFLKHAFHNGKYCDVIRMALFNPNYRYD